MKRILACLFLQGDFPLYRDFHTMTCHPDGHLLVFGGREMTLAHYTGVDSETYPQDLHMFHCQRKAWIKLPNVGSVPLGRRSHSSCERHFPTRTL